MTCALTSQLYTTLQNQSQRFNEEFIRCRETNDPKFCFDAICKAMEIIDGIEFLGSEIVTDEFEIWTRYLDPKTFSIGDSRFNLAILRFRITQVEEKETKQEEVSVTMLFPKLIDNFFFQLNGSNYAAIYQIVDKSFYITKNAVVIKTLSAPLVCNFSEKMKFSITSVNRDGSLVEGDISRNVIKLKILKKELNPFLVLCAKYGIEVTMQMTDMNRFVKILDNSIVREEYMALRYMIVPVTTKTSVVIDRLELKNNPAAEKKVFTFVHLIKTMKKNPDVLYGQSMWQRKLGSYSTTNTNAFLDKAYSTLQSFERMNDDITKMSLNFIPDEDKSSSYALMIWLMNNIDLLKFNDNFSIFNKRLRFWEFILYPLQLKFNKASNRAISGGRAMNFLAKKRLFSNLPANLITKQLLTTNLHRYDNCTSGVDLVSAGLKYSARGPQSIAEQNTDISLNHRDIHPSFMGIIDVFTNSNSDPGLTGCFNPFVHIDKNMFFSDKIASLSEEDLADE